MSYELQYSALPTLRGFHGSAATYRCVVGPVGSGKTSAMAVEVFYYLPKYAYDTYGLKDTRWVVLRNTYRELADTTQRTILEWFPWGKMQKADQILTVEYPDFKVEALFRSCDRPEDIKKFKSLEITGYWIDESIEVPEPIKLMLQNRIGRYPRKSPVKWGIETTNPPDVDHAVYSKYQWQTKVPGPIPEGKALQGHLGWWQPPRENDANLPPNYYLDLIQAYEGNRDWVDRYIMGKPGIIVYGKPVFRNFDTGYHVADKPLELAEWKDKERPRTLFAGWDNTGNCPAAVIVEVPEPGKIKVLREYFSERMGIVDFGRHVAADRESRWPGCQWADYCDPAGVANHSKPGGGLTSNAELMREELGLNPIGSEQNWEVRRESVEGVLGRRDAFKIDPSCRQLINGFIGGYCYPEIGTTGRHHPTPEKNKYSHCLLGDSLIDTSEGLKRIDAIVVGDTVLTPYGHEVVDAVMWKDVYEYYKVTFSDGTVLRGTGDHPVYVGKSIIRLDSLQYDDIIIKKTEVSRWEGQWFMKFKSLMGSGITESLVGITSRISRSMAESISIGLFGKAIMGTYPLGHVSITSMGTGAIIESKTLLNLMKSHMPFFMPEKTTEKYRTGCLSGLKLQGKLQRNGISQKLEENGTENMVRKYGKAGLKRNSNVLSAGRIIGRINHHAREVFARWLASRETDEQKVSAVKIERFNEPVRVYDLTVRDTHCFFANGVLVGNCHDALQYIMVKLTKHIKVERETNRKRTTQKGFSNWADRSREINRNEYGPASVVI